MSTIPANVQQVLLQLVPAAILKDITCFVFYDKHPRDEKRIDITICTKMGDVREYYKRDLISSVNVDSKYNQTDIKILRNSQCELFYLVFGGDELTILSRGEKLLVHHKLNNVSKYEISDSACSGQGTLKVFYSDGSIPVVPDDNFENFRCLDFSLAFGLPVDEDPDELLINLKRKLTEAKFNVKSNEKMYENFLKLRHSVGYSIYKEIHPNLDDSLFKDGMENLAKTLKIHIEKPWIKSCNKKIVMAYFVCNKNEESLEELFVLLHGTTKYCVDYTTKIFEKTNIPPFWKETQSQILKPNTESAIVVVIDLEELKDSVVNKMEFNGVISFKKSESECIVPIDNVVFSSLDIMGEQFDVLCSNPMDSNIILAILASTVKTDLILRHIKTESNDQYFLSIALFCNYLDMEKVSFAGNIAIFRKSPYHVLNGVMIVADSAGQRRADQLSITVYSRTSSQVLALIHHMHNAVPYPIVTTTPGYKTTAKNDMMSISNITEGAAEPRYNYVNYASSMLERTALVIEYLDKSIIQMSESKNQVVWNKIGSEIDLFAQGEAKYKEFKDKMWAEAAKGVKMLNAEIVPEPMSDEMFID